MTFCRHMCLPKNYPYAKFGCHSLIHDVTMVSLLFFQQKYKKFCRFANLALLPDNNVASAFISFSEMLECG